MALRFVEVDWHRGKLLRGVRERENSPLARPREISRNASW